MFHSFRQAVHSGAVVLVLVFLGGCSTAPEPYVYISDEFNRARPGFGQPVADPKAVHICYSTRATPWEEIQAMASKECGRVGKTAIPVSRSFLSCSLSVPTMARFACE